MSPLLGLAAGLLCISLGLMLLIAVAAYLVIETDEGASRC
jgi:hypothetical protein